MKMKYALMALALVSMISTAAVAEDAPAQEGDRKAAIEQKFEARKAEMGQKLEEHKAKAEQRLEEHQAERAEKFAEHKAERLKHMGERIAAMQKRQACVQAAADFKAMKACMPDRMKKHGKSGTDSRAPEKDSDAE